ncbi:phage protease [Yokenella regensburgei]|uniref:phage protease n=1 Tax=Yokenella regensburgei TaxID=158877 RepID=UPI003ED9D64E
MPLKLATASLSTISKDNASRIQLFPAGWFGPADGSESWYLDAALAQTLIAIAERRQNDYLFDYEHQSLSAPKASGPVPASGWFKKLYWVEGEGLFSDVRWTAKATSLIQADEYRYVSPTFRYDQQGNVRELVNAALTNMPVLDGMRQVAASLMFFTNDGDSPVDELLEQLRWMLNLPITATAEDIKAELQKLIERLAPQGTAAASVNLLNFIEQQEQAIADGQTQIAALSVASRQPTGQPDPAKYVPVAVVDELRTQLAALSTQYQDDRVEKLMTAALSDGRVLKGADEDNLRELGKSNFALMEKMIGTRKPIKALSQLQSDGMTFNTGNHDGGDEMTAEQLAICSQFGNTAEDLTGGQK